jgi:hypothetical protein
MIQIKESSISSLTKSNLNLNIENVCAILSKNILLVDYSVKKYLEYDSKSNTNKHFTNFQDLIIKNKALLHNLNRLMNKFLKIENQNLGYSSQFNAISDLDGVLTTMSTCKVKYFIFTRLSIS